MKMMICDMAETCDCEWECPERDKHEENKDCKKDLGNPYTICLLHPESKCIPYVDPVLKRIQERFNAWANAITETAKSTLEQYPQDLMLIYGETNTLREAKAELARIIQEESEK